ncbi:MAG: 4Fe-4S binding protein [candidate division WOR-3 bacterium]|nr:4Fe-4S binding protein [candidate division WOR-3 bacterium]
MGLKSYQRIGVLRKSDLKARGLIPGIERLKKGPVVIVECVENIPCNPCVDACPRRAITMKGNLTDTPQVDFNRCNGCGMCVARCPGLAIFVVNYNYSLKEATVSLPYELLPRPETGEKVVALNRQGKKVCDGRVVKVLDTRVQNRCAVVTVAVPKRYWNDVRGIALKGR